MPLRVGLMSWAVYDKIWQSLKIVTPTPVLHHTAEHLMLVGGLEVEALKTMMVLIDKQRVRHLSSRAKRSLFAASKQLAADIKLAIEAGRVWSCPGRRRHAPNVLTEPHAKADVGAHTWPDGSADSGGFAPTMLCRRSAILRVNYRNLQMFQNMKCFP